MYFVTWDFMTLRSQSLCFVIGGMEEIKIELTYVHMEKHGKFHELVLLQRCVSSTEFCL
jgi:hypothetical protein